MERKQNRVIVEGEGQEGKIVLIGGVDMKRRSSEVGGEEDEMVPENPVDLQKGELENRIGIENGEGKWDGKEAVLVKKKGNGEDLGGDCDGDLRGIGDLEGKGGKFGGGKEVPKWREQKRKENGQGLEVSVKQTVNEGEEENGKDLGGDSDGNLRGKGEGFVGGKEEPKRRGRKRKGSENLGGNGDSVKKAVHQWGQGKKENGDLGGNGEEFDSVKKGTTRRGQKKKGNGDSVKKAVNHGGQDKKESGDLGGKGGEFVGGKEMAGRRGWKRKGSENLSGNENSVKKTVNQGGQGKKENGDLGGNGEELDSEKKVTTRGRKKKGNENLDGTGGESLVVKKSANPRGRKKKGNEKDSEIDNKKVRENGGLAGKGEENGV